MGCKKENITFLPEIAFDTSFTPEVSPPEVKKAGELLNIHLRRIISRYPKGVIDEADDLADKLIQTISDKKRAKSLFFYNA